MSDLKKRAAHWACDDRTKYLIRELLVDVERLEKELADETALRMNHEGAIERLAKENTTLRARLCYADPLWYTQHMQRMVLSKAEAKEADDE